MSAQTSIERRKILFDCPNCGQTFRSDNVRDGADFTCHKCQFAFTVLARAGEEPASSPIYEPPSLIITTGNSVDGYKIAQYLGIVRGVVVRAPSGSEKLFGGLKAEFIGGNVESFAGLCDEARQNAFDRMEEHARARGADAVIAFRYDATEFAAGITEVLAYGTAVKLASPE